MLRIGIIGGGLMGAGLAQLFAARGYEVDVVEPSESVRDGLHDRITSICNSIGEATGCVHRVSAHAALESISGADFIIEAAPERVELKQALFTQLLRVAAPYAVLGTNSSVIPVSAVTERLSDEQAARVIGTHFWNPPYLIPLVEVIQGPRSGATAIETALQLLRAVGKKPVHIRRDVVAGNRLQHALWREAMALVEEGITDAAGVDELVKSSIGLRLQVLGPLENADLVGLDLTWNIHEVVLPELDRSTAPLPVLTRLRDAGHLGMRTGRGFYSWTSESAQAARDRLSGHLLRVLSKH
jgi:3-hydroxybutyryl-CoA dehydrogenase